MQENGLKRVESIIAARRYLFRLNKIMFKVSTIGTRLSNGSRYYMDSTFLKIAKQFDSEFLVVDAKVNFSKQ